MPPIASTSLTPATAPPTITSTRRPSTRPTRKGKERAVYVPPTYDFDLPLEASDVEAPYHPRSRQLKRRQKSGGKRRAKGKKGSAAEGVDEEMDDGADEPTTTKGKGKGKDKAKVQAGPIKRKKTVRIALPNSSDSGWPGSEASSSSAPSSSETYGGHLSTRRRRRRAHLDADDPLSLPSDSDSDARTADNDYANPANLPPAVHRRSKTYWRSLEYGVYTSVVHDVAKSSADLGRMLLEWDALRRRREAEEKQEQEERKRTRDDDGSDPATPRPNEEDDGASVGGSPAPKSKRGRPKRPRLPSHDPSRSLTPYALGGYETGDTVGGGVEGDEQVKVLALPSSAALGRMARWPLHASAFGANEGGGTTRAPKLEDELATLIAKARTRARRQGRIAQPAKAKEEKAKPRSAYAAGGPFADYSPSSPPSSSSSSDADSDLSVPLDSDLDIPSPSNPTAPITSLLSSLVLRLLDFVPKVPLPAYDIWAAEKREKNMRVMELEEQEAEGAGDEDEENQERRRQKEGVPGWEEVVALARESGDVPDHVVDKLEKQLIALYGPSQRPPVVVPPLGGIPALQLVPDLLKETKKRAPKRKGEDNVGVVEAQGAAGGDPRPDPFPSASGTASASGPLPLPQTFEAEMTDLELPTPPAHFFQAEGGHVNGR
ncbi:hypothetical protein JCM5296_005352 [Sporobolomyces johnsonii]